ncbi:MAG: hypothetical protein LWW97_00570 [Deltaproteobacteria bacterium]|nr:hypothetical protein [Deltaproteobacteria bacterium]
MGIPQAFSADYRSFSVQVICPQGIAFFMIIRSDQEKSTKKPSRPQRRSGSTVFIPYGNGNAVKKAGAS